MSKRFLIIPLLVLGALVLAACNGQATPTADMGQAGQDMGQSGQGMGDAEHQDADVEHQEAATEHQDADTEHEHVEVPAAYADLVNPYAGDAQALAAGEQLYQTFCVSCHGPQGQGDGPAAAGLNPPPANLADGDMMSTLSDGFLYWRISEGMMATGMGSSAMPAFGMMMSDEQIWQVITFVRSLSVAP